MKSTLAILLIFFILLQSGVLTFQYVLKFAKHKKSVEIALKDGHFEDHLITIKTSESVALEWENDHEFFMNGEKYDVVSKSIINGEIIYKCINDRTEETLIKKIAGSEKKSTQLLELFKKLNLQLFCIEPFKIIAFNSASEDENHSYLKHYTFIFSKRIIKPPIC